MIAALTEGVGRSFSHANPGSNLVAGLEASPKYG